MDIAMRFPEFSAPMDVTDHEFAFGARDPDRLMPPLAALSGMEQDLGPWRELAKHLRHNGLDPASKIRVRPGIQPRRLMRHLGACLICGVPAQERDLRVGALLSAWIDYIRIPGGPMVMAEPVS